MELVPQPLGNLIRRAEREPAAARAAFNLSLDKMWRGTPRGLDMSRTLHGARAANVVGPAAGPHTQLAQNLALSYLAGGRVMELKTVQVLDTLKIPRPCIDATNIGFNVEWSQELRISQSRDEYVKGALLIAALQRLGLPEGLPTPDRDHIFDLSLGYDLAGVSSEAVTGFVRAMLDARETVDRLLESLPDDLARYRDLSIEPRLISSVTLSTFHGCPAHEIETIARYLLEQLGVHVVVKLNPTLLGFETVRDLLHGELGYVELGIRRETFERDLVYDDALAMIARLRSVAHRRGLGFGVKLTNTLVVDNHKRFFTEKEMYLSGQPLHVLATQLYARLRRAVPRVGPSGEPPVAFSFSAGIDQHNFDRAARADLVPVTTCTDLLRPGGYARLPKYLENLAVRMTSSQSHDLDAYILGTSAQAMDALAAASESITASLFEAGGPVDPDLLGRLAEDLARGRAPLEALEARVPRRERGIVLPLWVYEAGTAQAERLATHARTDARYKKVANAHAPKKIGSKLALFDCINCDKCVPVCPNDANFVYRAQPQALDVPTWRFEGDRILEGPRENFTLGSDHQLATFVDACNACGNCDVFCPEDGGPYVMKPHWFGGRASFEAVTNLDGFYLESKDVIVGRVARRVMRLERSGTRVRFENDAVVLVLGAPPELSVESFTLKHLDGVAEVSGAQIMTMLSLLDGVGSTVNPVSAAFPDLAP